MSVKFPLKMCLLEISGRYTVKIKSFANTSALVWTLTRGKEIEIDYLNDQMFRLLSEVVKRPIPCNFSYIYRLGLIFSFFRLLFFSFFFLTNIVISIHPKLKWLASAIRLIEYCMRSKFIKMIFSPAKLRPHTRNASPPTWTISRCTCDFISLFIDGAREKDRERERGIVSFINHRIQATNPHPHTEYSPTYIKCRILSDEELWLMIITV